MIIKEVITRKDFNCFYLFPKEVYQNNLFYRATEDDIMHLLLEGPTAFHSHASVNSYLVFHDAKIVARFALIRDGKRPEYVQISFFEALPDIPDLAELIAAKARTKYPDGKQIVFGLNGHLNYGAGILLNCFDRAPVFGLPYSPEYYQYYFRKFTKRAMVSYHFSVGPFVEYRRKIGDNTDFKGITVRKLNKKRLLQETEIYTYLNNACFSGHPFWADREVKEDFELFHPFRFLIKEENLLFAEKDGEPIGFFLWYPDFNQLVKGSQHLGLSHVLKYHFANPIDTFRFTEIAVLPKYEISHAVQAMILYAIPYIDQLGIKFGEGGFIFEENLRSISMTRRFLERVTGKKMEPYRRYALFECPL